MDESPCTAIEGNTTSEPTVVLSKAKFAFTGKNNDELTFGKNDVILITQQLDGGWWEGTLNGLTGWFPSNYVVIISEKDKLLRSKSVPNTDTIDNTIPIQPVMGDFVTSTAKNVFREEVLKDYLNHESLYLLSLRKTYEEYLRPLKDAKIMPAEDYSTLSGNIEQIILFQNDVMNKIQLTLSEEVSKQRVGGVMIAAAPALQSMMMQYCENHPKAVEVLNEKKEELESFVKSFNGDRDSLRLGLSEPFRHLDRYPTFLQELERAMPDSHIDRGDVQRSCVVYRDMKYAAASVRKQKEMQLEFLAHSHVDQWATFAERGKIKHLGLVEVERAGMEGENRFLVLFSKLMLILEVTAEQNEYKLSEKWKIDEQIVGRLDGRHGFAFGQDPPILFYVASSFEVDRWLEAFGQCEGVIMEEGFTTIYPTVLRNYDVKALTSLSPPRQPEISHLPVAERARVSKKPSFGPNDFKLNHELEMIVPEGDEPEGKTLNGHNMYSGSCLRPYPPLRGYSVAVDTGKKSIKMRKEPTLHSNDDAILLRIIEGYWQGGKSAPPAYDTQPPQLIVAEDEKILVEEIVDGEVVFQEKSLVDTVYALKDQVHNLQQKMDQLMSSLEKEQRARRRLEDAWRRGSGHLNITSVTSGQTTPKPDSAAS